MKHLQEKTSSGTKENGANPVKVRAVSYSAVYVSIAA